MSNLPNFDTFTIALLPFYYLFSIGKIYNGILSHISLKPLAIFILVAAN